MSFYLQTGPGAVALRAHTAVGPDEKGGNYFELRRRRRSQARDAFPGATNGRHSLTFILFLFLSCGAIAGPPHFYFFDKRFINSKLPVDVLLPQHGIVFRENIILFVRAEAYSTLHPS